MFSTKKYPLFIIIAILLSFSIFSASALGMASNKVLVVMSYEENNPWCMEIKAGIDSVLADSCDLFYYYMDTKIDAQGGKAKAEAAYELFREIRPDGVISVDDNAQWMFVLPFLRDKVDTPVMFCGVNADPQKYGYPAANVSGCLERGHIRESIAFAKQLIPSVGKIGFLAKSSPSGKALFKQVKSEESTYLIKVVTLKMVRSVEELLAAGKNLQATCDIIYIDSLEGIIDGAGKPLDNKEITYYLKTVFDKPIIGANRYHVSQGALCAVVKTGQEQGKKAAKMILKALQGTVIADIPITRNYEGRRIINATVMKQLGVNPKPVVLIGAELLKSED